MLTNAKIIIIALSLFFAAAQNYSYAQDNSLPKNITVLGKKLNLKQNSGDDQKFLAEYIPENETFENWTLMFAIRHIAGDHFDPKATAVQAANNIAQRKAEGDLYANSMILAAPDGKSVAIDFLVSDKDLLEHNVWRYFIGSKGLSSYQIARRSYGISDNAGKTQEFISDIKTKRSDILEQIMRADLPLTKFAE